MEESFSFGGLSPPNRRVIPLRPLSLRGETSILDKSDKSFKVGKEFRKI
jgi:hypothetical protein